MPIFLVEIKTKGCAGSDNTSSSHHVQSRFLGSPGLCRTLSEVGAYGLNSDSDTEKAIFPCCKALRQELREPETCILQRGHVSIAKYFISSGPDSPLWLDCAQCKTRIGEQRWLEATFMLLHSGSSWGLAGPQGRFKSPQAIVAAGDC